MKTERGKFEERKIPLLKKALRGHDKWSSDVLTHFFHLLLERDLHVERSVVDIVDPGFLSILVDKVGTRGPQEDRNTRVMIQYLESSRLILFPLLHREHWSLLAYIPEGRCWMVCDSLGIYHKERVAHILHQFYQLGVLREEVGSERIHFFYPILEKQKDRFESGSFTLFYALMMITTLTEMLSNTILPHFKPTLYLQRLERDMPLVSEELRLEFTSRLELTLEKC